MVFLQFGVGFYVFFQVIFMVLCFGCFPCDFMVFGWFPWYFKVVFGFGVVSMAFQGSFMFLVRFHSFQGIFMVSMPLWFVSMVFKVGSWQVPGRFVVHAVHGSCCTIMKYGDMMFYNLFFFFRFKREVRLHKMFLPNPFKSCQCYHILFLATVQRRSYVSIFSWRQV